jgi:hypothetical protein
MNAVREIPERTVVLRDWSKVKTRWRTVVVAMSMERSSTGGDVSRVILEGKGGVPGVIKGLRMGKVLRQI